MKLTMLTAVDYPTAKILDQSEINYILVGDSLAMTTLGHKDTKSITISEMVHHTKAVKRAVNNKPIVVDLPINTYNTKEQALLNANLLLDAGADIIKLEGNKPDIISHLLNNNISIIGHLGLLPQSAKNYTIKGTNDQEANSILNDAIELDHLNLKAIVLECIPSQLAKSITTKTKTPTIGIGAGPHCDGQVLVLHDIIGLSDFSAKMIKQYTNTTNSITKAINAFITDVNTNKFPGKDHSYE